jgi:ribosomal-protein-alanine N-acetyltransferase
VIPTIETGRLVLRRMRDADAPALHAIMRDAQTMRFWSTLPHGSLGETEAFVAETVAAVNAGTADDFAITLAGAVIGKAGLWQGNEMGILLARPQWGQGFAAEAARAVIGRAFARRHNAVVADVDPRNTACLRMLGRLGFRQTGEAKATYLIDQDWVDSVYLSLTSADYGT